MRHMGEQACWLILCFANLPASDLWWAVRGAAPCFGIVTRITAKAYPVPSVYSGNLI